MFRKPAIYTLAVIMLMAGQAARGSCASSDPLPLASDAICAAIRLEGAQLVVLRLKAEEIKLGQSKFGLMLELIGKGGAEWIRVADELFSDCTLRTREDLYYSVALALPENPAAVLPLLKNNRWPLDRVCDAPFVEASLETWQNHLLKTRQALGDYNNPAFEQEKTLCLRFVDWAINRYPKPIPEDLHFSWYPPEN